MIPNPPKVVETPFVYTKNIPLKNFIIGSEPKIDINLHNYFSNFPKWVEYYAPVEGFVELNDAFFYPNEGMIGELLQCNSTRLIYSSLYRSDYDKVFWDEFINDKLYNKSNNYYTEVVVGSNAWCNVYTHFLIETLYVLIIANREKPNIKIAIANKLLPKFKEIIKNLGLGDMVIYVNESDIVSAKKMYVSPSLYAGTWYNHNVPCIIKDYVLPRIPDSNNQNFPDKLYISRKNSMVRSCENEADFESSLIEKGFKIVLLEELNFFEQVQLFMNAEYIIGAHGSGLANIIFSNNATKVIEIIPTGFKSRNPVVDRSFWNLASSVGIASYNIFYQPNTLEKNTWSLNIDQFNDFYHNCF